MSTRTDPIVESVRQRLLDRSQVGLKKYGHGVDRTDLTTAQWLRHAQEEALDLANYLERIIQDEPKESWLEAVTRQMLACQPGTGAAIVLTREILRFHENWQRINCKCTASPSEQPSSPE